MTTLTNPTELHDPTSWGYSHTAVVPGGSELVLVAGQYSSDEHGAVTTDDFAGQVARVFDNLRTAVQAHDLDLDAVVQLRTYVVDHDLERLGAITGAVTGIWGDAPPTQTVVGVAALATPEVLFEVEAVAVRTGASGS